MEFIIRSRHTKLTEALRRQIDEQLRASAERLCDDPAARLSVDLDEAGGVPTPRCRITLDVAQGESIAVSETAPELASAIERANTALVARLERLRAAG